MAVKGAYNKYCKIGHDKEVVGRAGSTCLECKKELSKKYHTTRYTRRRDHQWRYRGIKCTEELFNDLLERQNNSCAICKRHRTHFKNNLSVDHNHKTGKVRGLLCCYCNQVIIGVLDNKLDLIKTGMEYLEKTNG